MAACGPLGFVQGYRGSCPLKSPGSMWRGCSGVLLVFMNLTLLHKPYEFNFTDGNGQRVGVCGLQIGPFVSENLLWQWERFATWTG